MTPNFSPIKPLLAASCALLVLGGCATVRVTEAPGGATTAPVATLPAPAPVVREVPPAGRFPAEPDGYQPPRKIGVLLPLSGQLARAAAPVRDGFLAAYYAETRARPALEFYDTAAAGAVAAYRRAAAEGATYVVGPLGRDEVDAVFASGALDVPMLALNRGDIPPPPGQIGFSLSPEDEGLAAAGFLLERGARNVLVLQGTDDSMRRAADAFRQRMAAEGATVAQTVIVGEEPADSAPQVQSAAEAAGLAGTPIDAVFMAVRGSKAHLLAAQLSLAGLSGRPVVATSQVGAGADDPLRDTMLDGIAFPTETWTVMGVRGLPPAATLAAQLPTARGPAARLFAFGHDAWLLAAYPSVATGEREGVLRGATGALRVDADGNVQRTPAWSTFREGRPVPLD